MMSLNITIVTENNTKAQLNNIQNIHLTRACSVLNSNGVKYGF